MHEGMLELLAHKYAALAERVGELELLERMNVLANTYTPTLTNVFNVAASTAYACQYMRVGNVVTVSGQVDIDPTAASTYTELDISLPIASAFTATNQLGGVGTDYVVPCGI